LRHARDLIDREDGPHVQRNLFGRLLGCLHHCLATGQHYNPSWAILVRKSVAAVDGVEGLAEVVGRGVGGDGLPSGLALDGAVAAGGLYEFPD
jgi:hypothetical protein